MPQARRVILVRHAKPRIVLSRPSAEWELSQEGQGAAQRLAALALFEHATGCYAGPEPKMRSTLAAVATERGLAVETDPAFAESAAAGWLAEGLFIAATGRFFTAPEQPAAPGWEPAAVAAPRFAAGVERLQERHGPVLRPGHINPGTFAVASGGRVLTAYLATLLGYNPETAFQVWRRLRMPDVAVLELSPGVPPRLVIPFGVLTTGAAAA
ncbi:MAG TPA: histidine phosphatase family protein [Chloroflexota bacterium]|nr:histidine phosphatase family protein [Chloroflexota bacterium]